MVGLIRPSASGRPWAGTLAAVARWALALLVGCGAAAAAEEVAEEATEMDPPPGIRLRVEWGRGTTRRWQGTIAVSAGEIQRFTPLGIEADAAASMWIDNGRLVVNQPSKRPYEGCDLDIAAPLDASLLISLSATDVPAGDTDIEIPLALIFNRTHSVRRELDEHKNILQIQRSPGDRLRVECENEAFLFQPGDALEFRVTPNYLSEAANMRVRVQARLLGAASKTDAWQREEIVQLDEQGSAQGIAFALTAPEREGVYDLELQVSRQRLGLWQPLSGGRRVQFLVLSHDPRLPDSTTEMPTETVLEIDPAKPSWWQRLPNIPMLQSLRKPLGSGDMTVRHTDLGELVELGADSLNPGWEAYPLPIQKPGEVHIVEIQYPSDAPQSLGISIVEPNQAGVLSPIGLDSGVYVTEDGEHPEGKLSVHRLVFWPRTQTPLLRLDGAHVRYGKIRVLGPRHASVTAIMQRDDWHIHTMLPRRFPAGRAPNGRLLAGFYDRPLFGENFGAEKSFDPARRFYLHDWQTFYQGGTRLVQYLHYMGHNGLMLNVLADGSALYPSDLVLPTPRYDTGVYFTSGQDARRKDVVEMLLRLFDREALTLIPTLDFSTPLPALEAIRRGDENAGIELIGGDGKPWLKRHPPQQQLAPYYNPLDERVQAAMIDVAREFARRYQHHRSLGGIALQLNANGYAQLPGADCGFDARTLERFQAATNVRLPDGDGSFAGRIAPLLAEERPKWLAWRAERMAEFYRQMQTEIAAEHPELKLYLAGSGLFDRPELARELRPVLARVSTKNEEALAGVGIDPKLFAGDEHVVLLRPSRVAPLRSLAAQAANLEVNLDPQIDRQFAETRYAGALFYHEPQTGRLPSFDAHNPFNRGMASKLVAQPVPAGADNRRRFVHTIATLDARAIFDGGRLLPIGQEHEMGPLVAAYRGLPDLPFKTVAGDCQPVTVRWLSHAGRTYIYFANDSPWKANVSLTIEKPADCAVLSLYPARPVAAASGEGYKQTWSVSLEGYDLLAAAFSAEGVKFSAPKVEIDEQIPTRLEAQIQDLTQRARVLKDPTALAVPMNRDFEQASRGGIAGWEGAPAPLALRGPMTKPGEIQRDPREPHSGRYAVRLVPHGNKVTLTSAPFSPPATGWLLVSVWLRTSDAERPPKWTVGLEGQFDGAPYRRQWPSSGAAQRLKIGGEWKQFRFEFSNLPTTGLSPLRLAFTCEGDADIGVDEVRLFDLDQLDGNELITLTWLAIQRAGDKLEKHEYADCWQLLGGYWPRYLRSFVPLATEPIANQPRPRRSASPSPPAKTGLYDRLRSLWR